MADTHFHPLKVRSVRPETDEAMVVSFDIPDELAADFRFTQGQYLTLRRLIAGEDVRRSYSICSAVQDQALRIAVKKTPGGVFSTAGAGVKTNLLVFSKGRKTNKIWYYDLTQVKVGKKTPLTLAHFGFDTSGGDRKSVV